MTGLSHSAFLQALGWATLNSFWQMALLWSGFLVANYLFNFSAAKKYTVAVFAIIGGFLWFLLTFLLYYRAGATHNIALFREVLPQSSDVMPILLSSASIAYLALFIIPAYRLYRNWRFVEQLKKQGLKKIDVRYKLFVQKVAGLLSITKPVSIYISEIIKSPVTIGYLKPIILLPIATVNNLTIQQVEAVLLHELSHIKRYDYLINALLSIIHTFLYFNPFVKLLQRIAEEERENCCDQTVLQFGYDKVSYASALLSLEKASAQTQVFAIGAAGKKNLLTRIEKIVGMEKKPVLKLTHFAGLVAGFLCMLALNSLLILPKEEKDAVAFQNLINPFYFFGGVEETATENRPHTTSSITSNTIALIKNGFAPIIGQKPAIELSDVAAPDHPLPDPAFMHVTYDETDAHLSTEQKEHIKATVETTKKVLTTAQWKEVEHAIADGLTPEEKAVARQEYFKAVENINWENLEKNLKAGYEQINWSKIDQNLQLALAAIQIDSLRKVYEHALTEIEKAECVAESSKPMPFPDQSVEEIKKQKQEIKECLEAIKENKNNKAVKL